TTLLRPDDRWPVAVSGRTDSVCVVLVLHELRQRGVLPGLDLHVAHVNYGLRGEESEKDEAYVRDLGNTLSLPVHVERAHLVPRSGQALQSQARDARYAFFTRVRREHGLTAVATGHTADDQAETILMWLLRGSGTSGLAGIPAQRGDGVIRPLLGVTREQVLDYLASRGVAYRTDSSNATRVYRRNRIRHEIVPLLRTFNPRIVQGLARARRGRAARCKAGSAWRDRRGTGRSPHDGGTERSGGTGQCRCELGNGGVAVGSRSGPARRRGPAPPRARRRRAGQRPG